jgi:hypothetical protein
VGVISGGRGSRETEWHCDREEHLEFIPELEDAISKGISHRFNDQSLIPGSGMANTDIGACLLGSLRNQYQKQKYGTCSTRW